MAWECFDDVNKNLGVGVFDLFLGLIAIVLKVSILAFILISFVVSLIIWSLASATSVPIFLIMTIFSLPFTRHYFSLFISITHLYETNTLLFE